MRLDSATAAAVVGMNTGADAHRTLGMRAAADAIALFATIVSACNQAWRGMEKQSWGRLLFNLTRWSAIKSPSAMQRAISSMHSRALCSPECDNWSMSNGSRPLR